MKSSLIISKMNKSKFLTILLILVNLSTVLGQQIPMFSSYSINKYLINPSYAGINGNTRLYGINRIQYAGFEGAPVTYMLTGDAGFKTKKFGIGGMLFSDKNSLIAQNGFQLAYSYNVKLSEKWNLGLGLNAGAVQWNLNFDQLRIDNPNEEVVSAFRSSATTFRSDFGFRINSDKIDIGVTLPQIVASKVNYSDYLKNANGKYTSIPHYIVNLGYNLSINEGLKLKPTIVVRGAKDIAPQIDAMALLDIKNKFFAVVGYRTNYAVSLGGGVGLAKGFTLGYIYDRPLNDISQYSSGSHEVIVGISFGSKASEEPAQAKGLSADAEKKLRAEMEKSIQDKLALDFEKRLNEELEVRVKKAVDENMAKVMESKPTTPVTNETKSKPTTDNTLTKEEIEKIKKDIEEKIKAQMETSYSKLIDDKIKKASESKPTVTETPKISAEEAEKLRKESEEKIRKNLEESLRKELTEKITKAVEEKMAAENKKIKEDELKNPKEYKMTAKDKAMIDSLKMKDIANEKKIADLEKLMKSFPENDRVENSELRQLSSTVHNNDVELKKFKAENKTLFDRASDAPPSKNPSADEPAKFVLVLACFKSLKEAQQYQKLAAQTFEFPDCKILKPDQLEGWYFVYQKTFEKKKQAWEAYGKIFEKETNTPKYVWVYVME